MAETPTKPTRRVLVDVPINTPSRLYALSASTGKSPLGKHIKTNATSLYAGPKRGIQEVDEPESPPNQHRMFMSRQDATLGATMCTDEEPNSARTPPSQVNDTNQNALGSTSQQSVKTSMSSLIDFDPEDDTQTSQQTAATELTQPTRSAASLHAETLRLRLRVAMFKVRTNQTSIPMSRLQISPGNGGSRSSAVPGPQGNSSEQHPNHSALPRLLPAPILRPTAYSARHITQSQIPSSPPDSVDDSPKPVTQQEVFRTPALPRQKRLASPLQLSSPSASRAHGGERLEEEEDTPTKSVVKGRAADGLLGLMRFGPCQQDRRS
ncbi:MAG: hypothetical protein LQ347_003233 [Umbilicaria vellea]|nr:MAG: hypothetical protein LQ347_003233 [Umbilicaria vellea]